MFKEWDLQRTWDKPTEIFMQHTFQKSENALKTAQYILKIMENGEIRELFDAQEYDGTLWVINPSYYRIFFLAQYMLAIDGKKLPKNTKDTHKTIELAFLYYFIIKNSGLEGQKDLSWENIKQSRLSHALELLSEANEEIQELNQQRAKSMVEYLDSERIKRQEFTYASTINAEIAKAKTSLQRAIEFGDIVKEYMKAVKIR